jgi:hypothetical protein
MPAKRSRRDWSIDDKIRILAPLRAVIEEVLPSTVLLAGFVRAFRN